MAVVMSMVIMALAASICSRADGLFQCGYQRCDRTLHYCDTVMNECVLCEGVCQPHQHPDMDKLCAAECPLYLQQRKRMEETTVTTPVNEHQQLGTTARTTALTNSEEHGEIYNIIIGVLAGIVSLIVIAIVVGLRLKFKLCTDEQKTEYTQTSNAENGDVREQSFGTTPAVTTEHGTSPTVLRQEREVTESLLSHDQRMEDTNPTADSACRKTENGRELARPEHDSGFEASAAAPHRPAETMDEAAAAAPAAASYSLSQLPGPEQKRVDGWVERHADRDDLCDLKQHDLLERDPHTACHPSPLASFEPTSSFQGLQCDDSVSNAGDTHGGHHQR